MNIIETNLSFGSLSNRSKTTRLILHHADAETCSAEDIHRWHLGNGWAGAGYHFLVRKDGKVYRLRPEKAVGAHASGSNSDSIGICFEGDFTTEKMSDKQKNAGKELVAYLKKKYGTNKVQKHSDVCATSCPGNNFPFSEIAGATGSSNSSSTSSASNETYSGGKSANYKVEINTPSGVNVRKGPDEDKYAKFDAIGNGKTVTITKVSGNWGYAKEYGGWICLEYTKKVTSGSNSNSSGSSRPSYKTGKTYTLQVELKVRTGAGTNYRVKKRSELTADGRNHDKDGDACLDPGTRITCQQVKNVGSDIWIKCPSGWIAGYYQGKVYVK